jgi:hypothetical protein
MSKSADGSPVSLSPRSGRAYDLQLHRLAVELDGPDFLRASVSGGPTGLSFVRATYEVDADGRDVGLCVGVVGETQQQARLADTGVSDEQQLEEVVVSGIIVSAAGAGAGAAAGGGGAAGCRRYRGESRWVGEDARKEHECQQQTKQSSAAGLRGQKAGGGILLGIHRGGCAMR